MPVWLLLLIYALATARLTGLIVADDITAPIRGAILGRLKPKPSHVWVAELISCQWCVSIWVAAVAAPIALSPAADEAPLLIPALMLAYSQIAGMLSGLGRG